MNVKVIKREVVASNAPVELDREFAAARWVYNQLLDFELEHQQIMDQCAPDLARVGHLIARLNKRDRWSERATGGWTPKPRPTLRAHLESLRDTLRNARNASPEWKAAKQWSNVVVAPKTCRRKAGESDEQFASRSTKDGRGRTRREARAIEVYKERRCHWASFNAMKASVDQAVKSVIRCRAEGMPADLRRLSWRDRGRISAQASQGGFRIVDYGARRIRCAIAIQGGQSDPKQTTWVELETFGRGNLPELPSDYDIREVELIRDHDGAGWRYWLCVTVRGSWPERERGDGIVGIDTGHRWMGTEGEHGIRAAVWVGSDGETGEIRIPERCAELIEHANRIHGEIDAKYAAQPHRKEERNRHQYRNRLERSGVRTQEQADWLSWERTQERRVLAAKKKARNVRRELYQQEARKLATRYSSMAIDSVGKSEQKLQVDESVRRVTRRHRDLVAAYELKSTCERYGVADLAVPARNSTRECPHCEELHDVTHELLQVCPATGGVYDQDLAAAATMLRRGQEAARKQDAKVA